MRTPRSPAIGKQRGWAWLSWAVPAAVKAAGILSGQAEARKERERQTQFAQNSLQWKAEDARRAGLHPLAALGASGYQASPVHVGGQDWSGLGQDLGRAFLQNSDQAGRDAYARKELSQFDSKRMSQENELRDMELEMARLRLRQMQQQVQTQALGYDIQPNQITAANPVLPSVAAGPAGPGFKATRIGNSTWDIGSSELSEWAEGAGLAGHALVPFWMWEQARARAMQERLDTDNAHRGKDPAYTAAVEEARRIGGTVERHRDRDGTWGWAVIPKEKPFFSAEERAYWRNRNFRRPPLTHLERKGGASGSW